MGDYFNEKLKTSLGNLRTISDFIPFFIEDPLLFEPGEKMEYSNAGYVVLGRIIEVISGKDYYDYIRENIYKPAGMHDSGHFEVDSITPNVATGYTRHMPDGTIHLNERRCNFFVIGSRGSSAGGGYSTAYDLLKLDRTIAQEVLLDSERTGMVYIPLDGKPGAIPRIIGIAGGAAGLTALYFKYNVSGHTVFVLSNYDPEDVEPLAQGMTNLFIPEIERGAVIKLRTKEDE